MKTFFISIVIIITILSCSKNDNPTLPSEDLVSASSLGLNGRVVNKLIVHNSKLIAATDNGVYVSNFSTNWTSMGLENKNIIAIEVINDNLILCSTTDNLELENPKLFKTEDSGITWSALRSNFGQGNGEVVFALKYNPNSNLLFATGYDALASSDDYGNTWNLKMGNWGAVAKGLFTLEINPENNDIWTGGQNGIEAQVINHSTPNGEPINSWSQIIPSPSTVETIVFKEDGSNKIIMGCEGGIILTENNGANWRNIKPVGEGIARFYYGLVFDNLNSNKIIAASFDKPSSDPQPLKISISNNLGESWLDTSIDIPEQFGGARCMLQKQENGKTVLYIGLWKGGVYKVTLP